MESMAPWEPSLDESVSAKGSLPEEPGMSPHVLAASHRLSTDESASSNMSLLVGGAFLPPDAKCPKALIPDISPEEDTILNSGARKERRRETMDNRNRRGR